MARGLPSMPGGAHRRTSAASIPVDTKRGQGSRLHGQAWRSQEQGMAKVSVRPWYMMRGGWELPTTSGLLSTRARPIMPSNPNAA